MKEDLAPMQASLKEKSDRLTMQAQDLARIQGSLNFILSPLAAERLKQVNSSPPDEKATHEKVKGVVAASRSGIQLPADGVRFLGKRLLSASTGDAWDLGLDVLTLQLSLNTAPILRPETETTALTQYPGLIGPGTLLRTYGKVPPDRAARLEMINSKYSTTAPEMPEYFVFVGVKDGGSYSLDGM